MKSIVLMSSAAAAALVLAAGSAQAADIAMPVVVPIIAPVVVPVPGPVKVIQIDTTFETDTIAGRDVVTNAGVGIQTASGWGFQLVVGTTVILDGAPFDGFLSANGRVYRAFGNATVGVFAGANTTFPGGGFAGAAGFDADYKTDDVYAFYAFGANFGPGGFQQLQSIFGATVERGNFEIDVFSVLSGPPLGGIGSLKVGYALGPITPYVRAIGGFGTGTLLSVGAGLDFEHKIGERLTLTANAELDYLAVGMGPTLSWQAGGGFEYALGGGDSPLTLHGDVTVAGFPGSRFTTFSIGLGLKFGEGRISGFSSILFDGLPGGFEL